MLKSQFSEGEAADWIVFLAPRAGGQQLFTPLQEFSSTTAPISPPERQLKCNYCSFIILQDWNRLEFASRAQLAGFLSRIELICLTSRAK